MRDVQLDAVNVLQRTQYLVPFSRLGAYDLRVLHDMTGPAGDLFEYWGHAASLVPMATQPQFRWRMEDHASTPTGGGQYSIAARAWRASQAGYIATVLDEVRARGPLAASGLTDPRRRQGESRGGVSKRHPVGSFGSSDRPGGMFSRPRPGP